MKHIASDNCEDDKADEVKNQRWIVAFVQLIQEALLVRKNYLPVEQEFVISDESEPTSSY